MGFDVQDLQSAVALYHTVIRVVIADISGSSPREVGAAMLVWQDGQSGTIGGGALEFEAANFARSRLGRGDAMAILSHHPLGPELGQCCGGTVVLLAETYDQTSAAQLLNQQIIARATNPGDGVAMPLPIRQMLAQARNQGIEIPPQLRHGWLIEPVHRAARPLWIWGAGHVGRALVSVFAPLPDFDITWVDVAADRFPAEIPRHVTQLPAANPAQVMRHAPKNAEHLVLTYSHALDLELCHQLLSHGFDYAGLIGSRTKWARFRARLASLGHSAQEIQRITCPIGQPDLGKHPQAIAIGVATEMFKKVAQTTAIREQSA